MPNFQLLRDLKRPWAIHGEFADVYLPSIQNMLVNGAEFVQTEEPEAHRPYGLAVTESGISTVTNTYEMSEAPEGSVAVVPLVGVMTRYTQMCGGAGTDMVAMRIAKAASLDNISAIVIQIDSGGGAVNAIQPLVEAIVAAKSKKPVVVFVDDLMASAALMSGVHADKIIAAHDQAEIGSLGVMAMFTDERPMYEKEGVVFHRVYADQSDLKNKAMEDALKGDYAKLISEELNPIAEKAIKTFKSIRTVTDEDVFRGEMYSAKEAMRIGLIDGIGNLDFTVQYAAKIAKKQAKQTASNQTQNSNSRNRSNMTKHQIPAILMILALSELTAVSEGQFNLTAEQVEKLQKGFGKHKMIMPLAGISFDESGNATVSDNTLLALNAKLTEAGFANADKRVVELEEQLKNMKGAAEELPGKPGATTQETRDVILKSAVGINEMSAARPWNKAAYYKYLGNSQMVNAIVASGITDEVMDQFITDYKHATTDTTQMDAILGDYYREVNPNIMQNLPDGEEISQIFPWNTTGTQDIYSEVSAYITEHLQPRNGGEWAAKGTNEFQANEVRLKPWEVTRTFLRDEMQQFMTKWLATKTVGTDPYQESFLAWFIDYIKREIATAERPRNAILGVYVTPVAGTPGKSVHSTNGALKTIQNLILDNRIKVANIGKGTYDHFDGNGNINKNHVFFKMLELFKQMPQIHRDQFNWVTLCSKDDYRERTIFMKEVLAKDSNFTEQERAYNYDNLTYKPVPYWPNGLYVITVPNNGVQLYREKADDNRMHVEKLKRNVHVHMDGAYAFFFALTGKKYDSKALLDAANYEYQFIITNNEFGAYTPVDMAANDTTPSVAVHNVLKTVANSGATVITTFDDSVVGQIIYVIGGSSTNASSIASNNTNFIGLTANISFTEGVIAKFMVTATGKFTLLELLQDGTQGAIIFAADDATPSVADGTLFMTSASSTTGNEDITDFDDAIVGIPFTVLGGGGTYPSTITKAAKFAYISATWTGTVGESIKLVKRPDGLFVETL